MFNTPQEWIRDCQDTIKKNFDNLVLLLGPEGNGKSTLALQVGRALDPQMTVDDIFFDTDTFIDRARTIEKGRVRMCDEALINHRKGMHGETIRLLDHLQVCRELNTHMLMCFPHQDLFEGAVLNYRVRWKIEIPRRGLWVLSERQSKVWRSRRGDEETVFTWVERGRFTFTANKGSLERAYREAKERHMRDLVEERPLSLLDVGFDRQALAREFRSWKDSKTASLGAPIQDVPEA